jgi:2-haloacid dehalogenase
MTTSLNLKALVFDVFGTCVNWRKSVVDGLGAACREALTSANSSNIPPATRAAAESMDEAKWSKVAQDWRDSYSKFTRSLSGIDNNWEPPPASEFKTVDEHHMDALVEILRSLNLEHLWTDEELGTVNTLWHRLDAWPDSVVGMKCLNTKFETGTLSNGNTSLLLDLKAHSGIEFQHIFSAEDFGAYKPSPKVYLGGCEKLGFPPGEVALVAAHLGDLMFANKNGLKTIYVERPQEEGFSEEQIAKSKQAGFVDLWITADESGFLTVAEKLGVNVQSVVGIQSQ